MTAAVVALATAGGTAGAGLATGWLPEEWGWRAVTAVSALLSAVAAVVVWTVPTRRTPAPRGVLRSVGRVLRLPRAWALLGAGFLEGAGLLGVLTLLPAVLESTGAARATAAVTTAMYGVAVLPAALLVGRASARVGRGVFIAVGGTAGALAGVVLAFRHTPAVALVAVLLIGLAWAALHSTLQTLATEIAPGERAASVSLFAAALFAGNGAYSAFAGNLLASDRFGTIFATAAALVLTSTGLGLLVTRRR